MGQHPPEQLAAQRRAQGLADRKQVLELCERRRAGRGDADVLEPEPSRQPAVGAGQLERQGALLQPRLDVARSLEGQIGVHPLIDGRGAPAQAVERAAATGVGEGGERLEGLALGGCCPGREHLVHRVDLHVPGVHSRRADQQLLAGGVEPQRLGIGAKEVDRRGAVEPEHVLGNALSERGRALELEPHLEPLLERDLVEAGELEEEELLRKGEVLLEHAVAGGGQRRPGEERRPGVEPNRADAPRRQAHAGSGGPRLGDGHRAAVPEQPEEEVGGEGVLAMDVEAKAAVLGEGLQPGPGRAHHHPQHRGGGGRRLVDDLVHADRQERQVLRGAEEERGLVHRDGSQLAAARHRNRTAQSARLWPELDDGRRRDRPQVVGQHEVRELVHHLGDGVVGALAHLGGDEGDPL